MLQGGFGDFISMKSYERVDGFDDERGCGGNDKSCESCSGGPKLSLLSLSALTSIGILRIQKDGAARFPANSLLATASK